MPACFTRAGNLYVYLQLIGPSPENISYPYTKNEKKRIMHGQKLTRTKKKQTNKQIHAKNHQN